MTDKQERFVQEYLIDLNGAAAYERAGYSATGAAARSGAARLLTNANISKAIAERQKALRKFAEVTQERVIEEYRRIAFADIRALFTWDEERAAYVPSRDLTDEEAAAIQSVKAKTTHRTIPGGDGEDERETKIELEIKTYDKLRALSDLAKHLGLLGPDGSEGNPLHVVPIQVNVINQQSQPHAYKADTQDGS